MTRSLNQTAQAARKMDQGHMLDITLGMWKGRTLLEMPGDDELTLRYKSQRRMAFMRDLAQGFVPAENMIRGVVSNAADYVMASEPSWTITQGASELEQVLTPVWNGRKLHALARKALRSRIREGEGAIRIRIPSGGAAKANAGGGDPITAAREWLRFEALDEPERLTITEDEDTLTLRAVLDLGADKDGNPLGMERTKIDPTTGYTVCELVKDGKTTELWRLPLGGRLPYVQIVGDPLITQGMVDNQAGANLVMTSSMGNSELAGQIMEHFHNMQPQRGPDVPIKDGEGNIIGSTPGAPLPALRGPGGELYTADTVAVQTVEDANGQMREVPVILKGGYERHGPVSSEPLAFTLDRCEYNIYAEAKQRHYLMQDKATATGEARKIAMSAFFKSLAPFRVDAVTLLRELLTLTLVMAYSLCKKDLGEVQIEPTLTDTLAEPSVQDRAQDAADYQAGKISKERWRARDGILDSAGEDKQIAKEQGQNPNPAPNPGGNP